MSRFSITWPVGAFTSFLLCILSSTRILARSLEPEDLAESWRWRTFDRVEGLPGGTISAIGHDRDDFIYAGTDRGLLRYNGFTWSALESAEPFEGGPVAEIVESGGDLYAATRSDVWLARYGLELHRILKGERMLLAAGPLGGAYALDVGRRALYHLEKEAPSRADEGIPLPEGDISDYAIDDRRIHWLATAEGLYRRDLRTRFRWQLDPDLGPELRGRPCLRLFVVKRQAVARVPMAAQLPAGPATFELWALFRDESPAAAEGAASRPQWLIALRRQRVDGGEGGEGGEGGWRRAVVDPAGGPIIDLVLDGEGNYLAVSEEGKVYLSRDGLTWLPVPELGVGSVALSGGVLDPQGYLWYRGGSASIVRFDSLSRRWERFHRGLGLPSNNVLSLAEASDGSLWAGTDNGVFRYPPGAPAEPAAFRRIGDRELKRVTGLAEDRTGKVWISGESFPGAFFFHEGSWNRFEPGDRRAPADRGIAGQRIRRIVPDRGGDLWFLPAAPSSVESEGPGDSPESVPPPPYRIFRYSASVYTVSSFRAVELPHGPASDLLQAQDKAFWIATDQGLLRWTLNAPDEPRLYTEAQGLLSKRIWAIAEAADGSIWASYDPSAQSGVTRIRGDRVETFDERNGLASPNAWSVAASSSPEGADVWFGTDRGIIRFDGECWYSYSIASLAPEQSRVLPLTIPGAGIPAGASEGESVLVGTVGQGIFRFRRDERRRPRITLLESHRTPDNVVSFRWDGRDFKNETPPVHLRFRSRLDDQPWTAFGSERARSIAGLAPGEHAFYVELRDLDGNANREKSELRFHVPSQPVLVSPFFLAALGGACGALGLVLLGAVLAGRLSRRQPSGAAALLTGEAFSAFPGAVLVLDGGGMIARLAGGRPEALGSSAGLARELAGRPAALLPLFQVEPARGALQRLLKGEGMSLAEVPLGPGDPRRADLRGFPVPSERRPGRGEGVPAGAIVLIEEVTAEREAMELRERSRRLSALQDLAARISSQLSPSAGDPRIAEVLDTLGRFAGSEVGAREPVALGELLEALAGRPTNGERPAPALKLPEGVDFDLRGQTGLWSVPGDRAGLALALREVIQNGLDAMPQGGRLSVRLRNCRIADDPGDLSSGPYVAVEVGDSGAGISPAEIGRAFDPFFSTKPRDRARGLGLSVAYGVVRCHRGDIRIVSSGSGTTVTLLLPADPGA